MSDESLEADIEELWTRYEDEDVAEETARASDIDVLDRLLEQLESGDVRAASPRDGDAPTANHWEVNAWVKRGILLNFALRSTKPRVYGDVTYHDVLGLRCTTDLGARGTRNTPNGTTLRRGAYVGGDAILMSPCFLNLGAYVGRGTLVDSCNTVGSCAQIGKHVKIGANTLIGGVLEPVEETPVIVEDEVSLGAGCRITSGFRVGAGAVIGENTLLTPRIPVYDLVDREVVYGHVPPERRVFTRFVESSIADDDMFGAGGAYKPAVVATDLDEDTLEATAREDTLRG